MKIFQSAIQAGKWAPRSVVAIGKFDGIHRGHQRLIRAAVRQARARKSRALVLTFDPSPEIFLGKAAAPILPMAKKLERLREMGVDGAVLLPFDNNLACLAPEAFAKDILSAQLQAGVVMVGEDFCFGKDRAGSIATLEALGPELGFSARSVRLVRSDGEKIAASKIRELLSSGRRGEAESLLGWKPD